MEAFLKQSLEAKGGALRYVTRDSFFTPSHSSSYAGGIDDSTKIYDWEVLSRDEDLMARLKEMYSMEHNETHLCLFPWEVRKALGEFFVPTVIPSTGVLSRNHSNQSNNRKDVLARVVLEQARSLADSDPKQYGFLEAWSDDIIERKRLEMLYNEMEVKQIREKDIFKRYRHFVTRIAGTTEYPSTTPTPVANNKQDPDQESVGGSITGELPPSTSSPSSTLFNATPPERRPSGATVEDYKSVDAVMLKMRQEGERLDNLSRAIDQSDHDRYYHTLSLGLFSKAMIVFWLLSIPLSIICLDAYAILVPGPVVIALGLWGYLLAGFFPSYWSLDAYAIALVVGSFCLFIYQMLRTTLYNFGDCPVNSYQLVMLWTTWLFLVILTVFAITLTGIKKRIISWNATRKLRSQKALNKDN